MSEFPEDPSGPRRVIGTPSPAPRSVDVPVGPEEPTFNAAPSETEHANNAEKIVAGLFILAFLAGCGFIAAYVGLEVGTATTPKGADAVVAALRSNLALGSSLAVALLALGAGSMIWVRHLTPERRDRGGAARDAVRARRPGRLQAVVRRGRGLLPDHQAAARPPHDAAGHRAAGAGAAGAAARPRPAAADGPAAHGLAQGAAGGNPRRPAAADAGRHRPSPAR